MKSKTPPPPQRQLMIKTKACQRLSKEVKYYQQEVVENESKLNEMKEQNKNPYDIKKFEEVLGESHMMIPDSKNRLEQALFDLASYVDSAEVKELATELAADEWFLKARELLQKEGLSVGGDNNFSEDIVEETDVSGLQEGEAF
ncbi:unnamed protein product [Pseudo-nitzschia multistriata]|uniref:Tubulin-specific chaperone A n=1 Tax=Pseudo-nitzschia multistriata TaxID=183589 RepID=A0A448Z8S7_9STRA|nr:unnamed protein product [Pseudo-nitzschia multistriata]